MAETPEAQAARDIVEWYWSPMYPESPKSEDLARRIAAALRAARREEREACIGDIRHLMIYGDARDQRPTYDKGWSEALLEAETNIRARAQESEG